MRNLEIKVRASDLSETRRRALAAGGRAVHVLEQTDTYFRADRGLLKLREITGHPAELIAYERPGTAGSRVSDYLLYTTADAAGLEAVLARSHAVLATVRKSRELILMERTRVHLDTVQGLGTFVELETAGTDRPDAEVRAEHERVMAALGLDPAAGIATGYAALLGAAID
jgi:adenylate cyclase class IV